MSRFLAAVILCAVAVEAQIPQGHLVYVNRIASVTVPAMGIVDPDLRITTPLLPQTGSLAQHGSRSVAIDPSAPSTLYSLFSTSLPIAVPVLQLTGNRFTFTTLPWNLLGLTTPFRLRWASGHGLLVLGRGLGNGMFLRNMSTGVVSSQPTPTLLPVFATDMVVLGSRAYASSEGDGTGTAVGTIVEWDLVANTDRVVGTNYPRLTALTVFSSLLLAGDVSGNLYFIDPVTGSSTLFLATGLGKITSIAVDVATRVFVVAENVQTWKIHNVFAPVPPLYTSMQPIDDLVIGPTPVPTMLTYGDGCVGSTSLSPELGFTGPPALGTTLGITLANALPNAGVLLVFGTSRAADPFGPLPRSLGFIGMPGCMQYTDLVITAFTLANGVGAAQLNIALPPIPILAGTRLPMQWLCLDALVNPFGATTSSGGECYVY